MSPSFPATSWVKRWAFRKQEPKWKHEECSLARASCGVRSRIPPRQISHYFSEYCACLVLFPGNLNLPSKVNQDGDLSQTYFSFRHCSSGVQFFVKTKEEILEKVARISLIYNSGAFEWEPHWVTKKRTYQHIPRGFDETTWSAYLSFFLAYTVFNPFYISAARTGSYFKQHIKSILQASHILNATDLRPAGLWGLVTWGPLCGASAWRWGPGCYLWKVLTRLNLMSRAKCVCSEGTQS